MASEQLTFELPVRQALGREAFFTAPSNAIAVGVVSAWRDWLRHRLVLVGARGSGKTHLAQVWQSETSARIMPATRLASALPDAQLEAGFLVVEDIDAIAGKAGMEHALLHLLNMAEATGVSLLMTTRMAPARLKIGLADLASRLGATQVARLEPPDDALLAAMLVKHFSDRQLVVKPDVVTYLVSRMDRSAAAVGRLAAALDRAALAQNRALTRRLAAEVLEEGQKNPSFRQ
ncbi:MAG: DnaA ATPase domain-containing protein [Paracoccaceae bacterium]